MDNLPGRNLTRWEFTRGQFTGGESYRPVSYLIKLQASSFSFIKNETLVRVCSCEFLEISKNTFCREHLRVTTSFIIFIPMKYSTKWVSFVVTMLPVLKLRQILIFNLIYDQMQNKNSQITRESKKLLK